MGKNYVDILAIDRVCDNISEGNPLNTCSQADNESSVNSIGPLSFTVSRLSTQMRRRKTQISLVVFCLSCVCSNFSKRVDTRHRHYLGVLSSRKQTLFMLILY